MEAVQCHGVFSICIFNPHVHTNVHELFHTHVFMTLLVVRRHFGHWSCNTHHNESVGLTVENERNILRDLTYTVNEFKNNKKTP